MFCSVVVPFLNEKEYIATCATALSEQQFPRDEFELIFVDNGSTDGSASELERFPAIQVLTEPRRDPYLARNRGIERARGDYVLFTDADCQPGRDWLAQFQRGIEHHGSIIAIGRLVSAAHASTAVRCYDDYYHHKSEFVMAAGDRDVYFGHAGNMAVKASLFKTLGAFDALPVPGDTEIIHRCVNADRRSTVSYLPKAVVSHLEVSNLAHCVDKAWQAGRYSRSLAGTGTYRPLTFRENVAILSQCAGGVEYGWRRTLLLMATLSVGYGGFRAGRLFGSKGSG